jgi:hypothetical protein
MNVRPWITLGIGAAFVAAVGFWRAPIAQPPDYWIATRDLPPNHQLESGDISGPTSRFRLGRLRPIATLVGKHLTVAKRSGDSIGIAELAPTAHFLPGAPRSRVAIYKLSHDDYLGLAIPEGAWVVPCYVRPGVQPPAPLTTQCSKDSLLVEAVHRQIAPADDSWIALRIPFCHSSIFGEYLSREHHFLMVAPVPPLPTVPARRPSAGPLE